MARRRHKGKRFAALCKQRGKSTREIAAAIGYSPHAVRSWRSGVRVPQWGALTLLGALLSVPPKQLATYFE